MFIYIRNKMKQDKFPQFVFVSKVLREIDEEKEARALMLIKDNEVEVEE
jgi:hypothetical protein